jgi:hypothetical protein
MAIDGNGAGPASARGRITGGIPPLLLVGAALSAGSAVGSIFVAGRSRGRAARILEGASIGGAVLEMAAHAAMSRRLSGGARAERRTNPRIRLYRRAGRAFDAASLTLRIVPLRGRSRHVAAAAFGAAGTVTVQLAILESARA